MHGRADTDGSRTRAPRLTKIKGTNLSRDGAHAYEETPVGQTRKRLDFHDQPLVASHSTTLIKRHRHPRMSPYNCVRHTLPCESKSKFIPVMPPAFRPYSAIDFI